MKPSIHLIASTLFAGLAFTASATTSTYSTISTADAFVTSGTASGANPNDNYGGAGALMVAGSASGNGTFDTLLKFDLSAAKTQFDTQLGVGNWTLTNITLTLAGNFATQGAHPNNAIFPTINAGNFSINWLANDTWLEGTGTPSSPTTDGVTFNTLASFTSGSDEALGGFSFSPPGNNVQATWTLGMTSGFVSDITAGSTASLLLAPADSTVSYLFNSRSFGTAANRPLLSLTVQTVPEPASIFYVLAGFASLIGIRRLRSLH